MCMFWVWMVVWITGGYILDIVEHKVVTWGQSSHIGQACGRTFERAEVQRILQGKSYNAKWGSAIVPGYGSPFWPLPQKPILLLSAKALVLLLTLPLQRCL